MNRLPIALCVTALTAVAMASEEPRVNVYNWSDYVAEDTLENFTERSGIAVTYDVYDSNEMLEAKLLAGRSGYDVIFPSARPFAARQISADILMRLDLEQLPNLKHLDPQLLASLDDVDPGNAHLVPYMWGTTGLGYNVAKVRAALGEDFELDTWALLFDPQTVAKLADCGVAVLDDEQEAMDAVLIHLGKDINSASREDLEAAQAAFAAIRPHVRYFHSSRYIDDLANGEICLAMGYSGDVLQARDRAAEAENDVEVGYLIPREGAIRWFDVAAIPADAPHPKNAHAFINYLLEPQVIADITNYVAYANPNLAATELVDAEILSDPGIYPSAEVRARLLDPSQLEAGERRNRVRAWTRIKAGR